ncbi:MAG TPA: hypothetical protein VE591_00930, partial [Candidatus Acidoferrum sp.]|nr:hypothetical protein [Candidatus Acidoferrum sp.]
MITRLLAMGAAVCALAALAPLPVRADVAEAQAAGLIAPANAALQHALRQIKEDGQHVGQAGPVGIPERPLRRPGLPQGLTWTLDWNVGWPYGNVGFNAHLPGGMDAVLGYGFSRTNRLQIGYYELSEYPVGFSNVTVPFYLQGFTGPGVNLPGASLPPMSTGNIDVTVKNKLLTVIDQNLFTIGPVPIVISPTYLSRSGTIGGHT